MPRDPKFLRGIWSMLNGKQDLEVSEELTNAYFGNAEAWQIPPNSQLNRNDKENQES